MPIAVLSRSFPVAGTANGLPAVYPVLRAHWPDSLTKGDPLGAVPYPPPMTQARQNLFSLDEKGVGH